MTFRGADPPVLFDHATAPLGQDASGRFFLVRTAGDALAERVLKRFDHPGWRTPSGRVQLAQQLWRLDRLQRPELPGLTTEGRDGQEVVTCLLDPAPGHVLAERLPLTPDEICALLPRLIRTLWACHQARIVGVRFVPEAIAWDGGDHWRWLAPDFVPAERGTFEQACREDLAALVALTRRLMRPAGPESQGLSDQAPSGDGLLARAVTALGMVEPNALAALEVALETLSVSPDVLSLPAGAPLIGCDSERETVGAWLRKAVHDAALQCLWLTSDSGAPIWQLFEELNAQVRPTGMRVLSLRCRPTGAPDAVLADLAHQLDGLLGEVPPASTEGSTPTESLAALLASLMRADAPALPPELARVRLVQAFHERIATVARKTPLCLVMLDYDGADELVKELVNYLKRVGRGVPVLLCLACEAVPEGLEDEEVLYLRPLFRDEVERLAMSHCPGMTLTQAALDQAVELGQGNPSMIYRLCLHWLRHGGLVRGEEGWSPTDEGPRRLPGEGVRELLRAFATLGPTSSLEVLKALMDMPETGFYELLESALDGGWLRQEPGWIAFWRPEEAAAFSAGLPAAEALRWHRRLAAVGALPQPVRASHAALGGQGALAAEMAIEAGQRLRSIGASSAAIDQFRRALEELGLDDLRRLELIEGLASLFLAQRDPYQALGLLDAELVRAAERQLPAPGRLIYWQAAALEQSGDGRAALAAYEQMLGQVQTGALPHRVRAYVALADAAFDRGERERGLQCAERALALANEADDPALLAEARVAVGRGMLLGPTGAWAEGLEHLATTVKLGLQVGQLEVVSRAFGVVGHAQLALEQWGQAAESFFNQRELLTQMHQDHEARLASLRLASIALALGQAAAAIGEVDTLEATLDPVRYPALHHQACAIRAVAGLQLGMADALRPIEQAMRAARALGDEGIELAVLRQLVRALIFLGKLARAEEVCQTGLGLAAALGDRAAELGLRGDLGELGLFAGDLDRAEKLFQVLRREAVDHGLAASQARALWGLAQVLGARGRLDEALELIQEGMQHARVAGHMLFLLELELELGRNRLRAGDVEQARTAFEAALGIAESLKSPHHLSLAFLGLGRCAADSELATSHWTRAGEHLSRYLDQLNASERKDFLSWDDRRSVAELAARTESEVTSARALVTSLPGTRSSLLALLKAGQPSHWGAWQDSITLLDEIFSLVTSRLPLEGMLERMNETFIRISQADRGMVYLLNEDKVLKLRDQQASPDRQETLAFGPPPELVLEQVMLSAETLWITDSHDEPEFGALTEVEHYNLRGMLCIPLKVADEQGERVIGCLYGDRQTPWLSVSEREVGLLELMARYISVSLEIGVLQDDSQRKTHRLEMLNDLSRALAGTLDLDRLLNLALMQILQVTRGEQGYLFFGDELACRASLDPQGHVLTDINVSRSVIARVTRDRQALAILDIGQDEELQHKASLMIRNVRSVMCVPLVLDDRLLGLIYISSSSANKTFTRHDLDLVTAIAAQMALALQNAQAYETIKELNLGLEVKVKDRTAELEVAYRELTGTQAQLLETEKLATIGTLAGGVAHEINNPLGAVLVNAQLLIADIEDPDQLDSLRMIEEGAKRCKEIVEALLKYSKPPQASYRPIELSTVVEETLGFLDRQLQQDDIRVETDLGTASTVMGDATELRQVMAHLMLNAMDAVRESGRGAEGRIQLSLTRSLEGVTLMVNDNGIGMTPEIVKRIFDPFFTTKKVGSGTGLGLSVCQRVVEKHGGRLHVSSTVGQGSTFIIELPAP